MALMLDSVSCVLLFLAIELRDPTWSETRTAASNRDRKFVALLLFGVRLEGETGAELDLAAGCGDFGDAAEA